MARLILGLASAALVGAAYYLDSLLEVIYRDGPGTVRLIGIPLRLQVAEPLVRRLDVLAMGLAAVACVATALAILFSARRAKTRTAYALPSIATACLFLVLATGRDLPKPLAYAVIWGIPVLALTTAALETALYFHTRQQAATLRPPSEEHTGA